MRTGSWRTIRGRGPYRPYIDIFNQFAESSIVSQTFGSLSYDIHTHGAFWWYLLMQDWSLSIKINLFIRGQDCEEECHRTYREAYPGLLQKVKHHLHRVHHSYCGPQQRELQAGDLQSSPFLLIHISVTGKNVVSTVTTILSTSTATTAEWTTTTLASWSNGIKILWTSRRKA